jgi:hypothetical protein
MQIVYRNKVDHVSHDVVDSQVWHWEEGGEIISDAVAQTIASWWHYPSSPNSTALSTMGAVTVDMHIRDFADVGEYLSAGEADALELDALEAYIVSKQDDE